MIRKFHPYVATSVFKTTPVTASPKSRTLGMLNHELELLGSLISRVADEDDEDPTYEAYVSDMSVQIETHPCSTHMMATKLNQRNQLPPTHISAPTIKEHIVRPDDPVFLACMRLLESWFGNTVETNLMLTSLLIDMASCCNVSLERWLLMDASMYQTDPSNQTDEEEGEGEDTFLSENGANIFGEVVDVDDSDDEEIISAQLRKILAARKPPAKVIDETLFFKTLRILVELVEKYRTQVPNLDTRLFERKHAFKFTESLNEALLNTNTLQASSRRPSKVRAGGGSDFSSTPSRSNSPAVNAAHLSPSKLTPKAVGSLRGRQGGHARNVSTSVMNPFGPHLVGTQIRIKLVNGKEIYNEQMMKPLPSLPLVEQAESEAGDGTYTPSEAGLSSFSGESDDHHISNMTLSHLLTNIVILQEFLKELSALLQIRSSIYNDITFMAPS
ncbi:hypothetical protein ABW20_dc0108861 [Dactylellina cionopaga]|nr:hypothetical protein ABW20_dc0108861 [Dactylellina cionopaga]